MLGDRVENGQNNENRKNVVVPVAQFEAFTVYEDDEHRAKIDQRLKLISKSNVYKGTSEDKFITKTELAEMERKKNLEKMKQVLNIPATIPQILKEPEITIITEKLDDDNVQVDEKSIKKSTNAKDAFFEMEEYRNEIFSYLKEHEVEYMQDAHFSANNYNILYDFEMYFLN